jgi:hypothetical protein
VKFFEKCRPEVYIHGAKLRRDKKTGKRLWGFTLIVTLCIDQVLKCDGILERAYGYILTLDNCVRELLLDSQVIDCAVDFYALIDDKVRALRLDHVDIGDLRMTREGETVELWFKFETELERSLGLHEWVKKFAYTRLWAEFVPAQGSLGMQPLALGELARDPGFLAAADRFVSSVRSGELDTMTISTPGMEPVVIDKAAAEDIHRRARKK